MTGDNSDTGTGIGSIGRMQGVVRCERASHLYLCTLERQSLCESHRQRRWLTHWSYGRLLITVPMILTPLERPAWRSALGLLLVSQRWVWDAGHGQGGMWDTCNVPG